MAAILSRGGWVKRWHDCILLWLVTDILLVGVHCCWCNRTSQRSRNETLKNMGWNRSHGSMNQLGTHTLTAVHYIDVVMGAIASEITSLTIVYSTVYSIADQRKHESSAPLAFVRVIHRGPVNSPHKWPVTRKMFPFDDVIMRQNTTKGSACFIGTSLCYSVTRIWKQRFNWICIHRIVCKHNLQPMILFCCWNK